MGNQVGEVHSFLYVVVSLCWEIATEWPPPAGIASAAILEAKKSDVGKLRDAVSLQAMHWGMVVASPF